MRRRYTDAAKTESCPTCGGPFPILVDRDGNVLGAVVGITIAEPLEGEGGGVSPVVPERQKNPVVPKIQEVWDHYVSLFDAERQTLNTTRRRIIEKALKVRSVEECKRALEGLRVWPWNNGENPEGRKYLDIRYALHGNHQRGESNEERIDTMADRAPTSAFVAGRIPEDHPRVQRWISEIRTMKSTGSEKARGRSAFTSLTEAGFNVRVFDQPPWVEVT